MTQRTSDSPEIPTWFKYKVNLFYLLAFIPLFLILYFDAWTLVIALYGFIFLLLKKQKLNSAQEAQIFQRLSGFTIIVASFFIYYALVLVFPTASVYGGANYIVFLFGLFLVFFDSPTLKEAFTPLFFIAAATSSSFLASELKPYFTPYLNNIAHLIVTILKGVGVKANIYQFSSIPVLSFTSLSGKLVVASFAYECLGIFSALVFSIILVIVLFEDPSSWKVRMLASVIGVLGTFALNIIRIVIVLLTDYFYGAEAGADVHYVIGYAFFSAWLIFFLYVYSKRKTIQMKIQPLWQRTNQPKIVPKST